MVTLVWAKLGTPASVVGFFVGCPSHWEKEEPVVRSAPDLFLGSLMKKWMEKSPGISQVQHNLEVSSKSESEDFESVQVVVTSWLILIT